jgi:hypothetical protein
MARLSLSASTLPAALRGPALGVGAALGSLRRRLPLVSEDPLWALSIGLGLYVLWTTWNWEFPDWRGIPFPPVWLALSVAGLVAWRWRVGHVSPIAATAIVVTTSMLMTDVASLWTQGQRDIGIYLKAGERWLAGNPIYDAVPLAVAPIDLSNYPFLYPPLTLPLFGALSLLPYVVACVLWTAASAAALLFGLRRVGLDWRWCAVMLVWPPVVQGLWVGNVAIPLFALFAIAPRRPAALAIGPIFKIYSGIATLWLLRREHWRSLVVGAGMVILVTVLTLPMVGVERWREWLQALSVYQDSQRLLPGLYGFGLARFLPFAAFAAIAGLVLLAAVRARHSLDQLARLGVATIVASPSLFSHGFLVAIPAMLRLDRPWLWLFLGITAAAPGLAWFAALAVLITSWFMPLMRKRPVEDGWHPLGAGTEPWPDAAAEPANRPRPGVRTSPSAHPSTAPAD